MFQARVKKLQEKLKDENLDALLITSVSNIAYLTGVTHFSKEEREAYIIVTKNHLYVFTDKRYTDALSEISHFSVEEISHQFSFSERLKTVIEKEEIKSLGFEEEYVSYSEFERLNEKFKDIELVPTSDTVESLRTIKTPEEIEQLKKATALTDKAFAYILESIKLGVTEQEVAAELEYFINKNGGGLAFDSIVAFGVNSAIPHHHTSDKKLTKTDHVILLDFGASWNGYCADMTRTVFLGKAPIKLKKMYETTRLAQEKAIKVLRGSPPLGVEPLYLGTIDQTARDYIISQGFPSIPHSVGHGIGLQVHESPSVSPKSETEIKQGMVITVEPGIYDVTTGGIRIEDDVLIANTGIEILTKSDKKLIEL